MIKVIIKKNNISITGHANYNDYGKDIVCSAVSSIVLCSVEAIASFNEHSIDVIELPNKVEIKINSFDDITNKLVNNMIKCLKELEKKYNKYIKIINREE